MENMFEFGMQLVKCYEGTDDWPLTRDTNILVQ